MESIASCIVYYMHFFRGTSFGSEQQEEAVLVAMEDYFLCSDRNFAVGERFNIFKV